MRIHMQSRQYSESAGSSAGHYLYSWFKHSLTCCNTPDIMVFEALLKVRNSQRSVCDSYVKHNAELNVMQYKF